MRIKTSIRQAYLPGGALGYTPKATNRNNGGGVITPGVPGGYMAVGLDIYGNFKSNDMYKDGFPQSATYFGTQNSQSFTNHVTIRGASGKNFSLYNPGTGTNPANPADNTWGYPIMYTTSCSVTGQSIYQGWLNTDASNQAAVTNMSLGSMIPANSANHLYSYSNIPSVSNTVQLSNNLQGTVDPIWDANSINYRKAFVDIVPGTQNSGGTITSGYYVTVSIQVQSTKYAIIKNYFYPSATLKYLDNSYLYGWPTDGSGNYLTVDATAPSNFSFGFAASSGSYKNMHALHNLYITLPQNAIVGDDQAKGCFYEGNATISNVLNNDYVLTANGMQNVGTSYISGASFRFNSNASNVAPINTTASSVADLAVGEQFITGSGNSTMVVFKNAAGIWTYSASNQNVVYQKVNGYSGVARSLYSILAIGSDETNRSVAGNLSIALDGIDVTSDEGTLLPPYTNAVSASKNLAVLDNDVSYTYNLATGTKTTTGASSIDLNSFLFTNADSTVSFTNPYAEPLTSGTWSYDASSGMTTFTLNNGSFTGDLTAYYRVSTQSGCLSNIGMIEIHVPYSLPVKYSKELKATVLENEVLLSWTTAQEMNNKGFAIQRSIDGINYTTIKFLGSKSKDSNSSIPIDYESSDVAPVDGTSYYRLKQEDLDGKYTYGKVVSVNYKGTFSSIKLYPNPAIDYIHVGSVAIGTQLSLYSMDGKLLKTQVSTTNTEQVNVSNLSSGLYILKVVNSNGNHISIKFMKK